MKRGLLLLLAALALLPCSARPAFASDVSIDAAGSTWVSIALSQWAADVARQGISVNYQGIGSTAGRVLYYQNQIDFAASEIPFTPAYLDATGTVLTNEVALAAHRPYAYLPDVGGGTSFMYHLDINGQRVTNLRLTPTNITKVFTGVIKNWNDPSIAADNPQLHLPNLPIRAVVRSDGAGTTAQFTAFMANQTPDIYNAFCKRVGLTVSPCPSVSLWPDVSQVSQQLSDGVANYVAAPYNNGAITYVEYGYAKQRGFPVASVLNKAGYFTQPTAQAVAIALTRATINRDLTQNLQGVYVNPDPRAYPVSSYSYMIVPTTTAHPFTAAKGRTLSRFILYVVCAGQQESAQLGYSPLPKNLVQDAFNIVRKIPGHVDPPPLDQCANPTITQQFITGNAPPPPPSARQQAPPPTTDTTPTTPTAPPDQTASGGVDPTPTSVPNTPASRARVRTPKPTKLGTVGTTPPANPSNPSNGSLTVALGPVRVPPQHDPLPLMLYLVSGVTVLILILGPPTLGVYLRKPKRGSDASLAPHRSENGQA